MTYTEKKNADILIPLALACAVGYWYFMKYGAKKWQGLVAIIGITFLAAYIATTRYTKSALDAAPHAQALPADLNPAACDSYDPTADTRAVYDDSRSLLFNSDTPYLNLLNLSDCQLVKCYNEWNDKYYQLSGGKTLPAVVAAQWSFLDGAFTAAQQTLATRFGKYNLT